MRTVGIAEAKAKLSELLGQVAFKGERIILQRRGKPVAALVPLQDLERALGETRPDWLDGIVGLCSSAPEVCDALDEVVTERQTERSREVALPWDGQS